MCAGLEQEKDLLAFGPSSYGLPKFGIFSVREEEEEGEAGLYWVIGWVWFRSSSVQTGWIYGCLLWVVEFWLDGIATPRLRRRRRNCEELLASGFLERVSGLVSHALLVLGSLCVLFWCEISNFGSP